MGTLLVEGKPLFPRVSRKEPPPSRSLMIDRILSLAAESGIVTTLALLEVDDAWVLQNEFGPTGFRQVLKTLAGLLQRRTPTELLVDRWGPVGFLCVHPAASLDITTSLLDTLQKRLPVRLKKSLSDRPVTFSAGIAEFPRHGSTRIEVLRRAEEALFVAQRTNKGTIQLPPPEEVREMEIPLSLLQLHRLSDLAKREGTTAPDLIREAVDEYLRRSQLEEL